MFYITYTNIIFWFICILLILKLYIKVTTGWCRSHVCLVGKTAIITGANCGIGYETAADFAKRGAKVILACRDPNKGKNAAEQIIKETDNPNVLFKHLDLCSFQSVRDFSEEILLSEKRLDILVNNAGTSLVGPEKTEDGLLVLMQSNYFGHFLLTNLLLDLIKKTPNSRIINVSSILARMEFNLDVNSLNNFPKGLMKHFTLYGRSKLCNILFTTELAERLKETSVTVYSLHPGVVLTGIWRRFQPIIKTIWMLILDFFFKDTFEGSQTTVHCSVAKEIEHLSGQHFHDCKIVPKYKSAQDPDLPKRLWEMSEEIVKLN